MTTAKNKSNKETSSLVDLSAWEKKPVSIRDQDDPHERLRLAVNAARRELWSADSKLTSLIRLQEALRDVDRLYLVSREVKQQSIEAMVDSALAGELDSRHTLIDRVQGGARRKPDGPDGVA